MWPLKTSLAYDRLRGSDTESDGHSVDGENEKQEIPLRSIVIPTSRLQKSRDIVLFVASVLCLWVVLVTAWRTTLHPVPRLARYEKKTLTCGNTTNEAEALGCGFDLLSHNWVAPPCLDPLTESEYRLYVSSNNRSYGAWPYFLDKEGTKRVGDERAFALLANGPTLADQHVHTTREEHLAHCAYLSRRNHRAAEGLIRLNDENRQFWHTEHCIGELQNPNKKPLNEINEGFYVGFAPCTIEVAV